MSTLEFIIKRFNLNTKDRSPIEISKFGKEDLARLFHELLFQSGAEIGVCEGIYSECLCRENPQALIYGIDPFVPYEGYKDYIFKRTINKYHQRAKSLLSPYPNYTLMEKFSMDAVHEFKNKSLDFVYIDANHDDPFITEDIREWSRKVRSGGIISGHDYIKLKESTKHSRYDVRNAVNKYVKENNVKVWFTTSLDNTKIREHDWSRSWIVVKP